MHTWSKSDYLTTRSRGFTFQQRLVEPGNYTVQFRVSSQAPVAGEGSGPGNITPTATIAWTIGGNVVQRTISIYDGASLTGIGEHVRVDVYDETDPGDTTPPQKYLVSVTVAEGERGTNKQPPTYTQYITNGQNVYFGRADVPQTSDVTAPIPIDAGVISVFVTAHGTNTAADPAAPIPLTEADVSVALLTEDFTMLREYDPRDYDWVPVPPQCKYIDLRNNTTDTETVHILITFAVTFGIDG